MRSTRAGATIFVFDRRAIPIWFYDPFPKIQSSSVTLSHTVMHISASVCLQGDAHSSTTMLLAAIKNITIATIIVMIVIIMTFLFLMLFIPYIIYQNMV